MELQIQPNKWSCLPTAFAMVLNKPIKEIIQAIGHDGSEIQYPDLREPLRRRCFHIQELVDICYMNGYYTTPIEAVPTSAAFMETPFLLMEANRASERLKRYLLSYNGVIIAGGKLHAVAWDCTEKKIYNPNGTIGKIEDVPIKEFWLVGRKE